MLSCDDTDDSEFGSASEVKVSRPGMQVAIDGLLSLDTDGPESSRDVVCWVMAADSVCGGAERVSVERNAVTTPVCVRVGIVSLV